ncbi:hypothetical protein [Tabrizicola sp.]|uniref:hypothetical protein n=1 Tax=Tabrizicola sp. TaxID=2005166 RepID=UPI003F367121
MTRPFAALALLLCLAAPTFADPIPGLDDPAFRDPFERALQGDDPSALRDLHAAASGGNTAALLALPFVSEWLRAKVPFAERKTLFYINGVPMPKAFADADPVAALWNLDELGSDTDALLDRAFGLYAAGEPGKATGLFMTWLNQTGGNGDLPPGFFNHPVPPWAMAFVLKARLGDPSGTEAEGVDALMVDRLRANDTAAWLAIVDNLGLEQIDAPIVYNDRLADTFDAAGIAPDEAMRRMQEVIPLMLATSRGNQILDPNTAKAATAALRADPEFQPLLAVCATTCPASQDQCATAFVAAFGHPPGGVTRVQPLTSLISTEDFFATPRGRLILLRSTAGQLGDDPATSPALAAARDIDACLADAILAALP